MAGKVLFGFLTVLIFGPLMATAAMAAEEGMDLSGYLIQPGDVLQITVWHEQDLQRELAVRPDGGVSFPLVGEVVAEGRTAAQLNEVITQKLERFIPDPVVTVSVAQPTGNRIYVIGEVARPGEFAASRPISVLHALSIAGGLTPYADGKDIRVLRGVGSDQQALPFNYKDVLHGENLQQNILLQPGDVVVVP